MAPSDGSTESAARAEHAEHAAEEVRLRRELAAVYRLVAHFRMTDLIFTHISLRLPGPEHHFLINPYGLLFEEITASNLVKIDLAGNPVEPTPYPVNPAGFVIHSAIHAARPDAQCVLHTHTKAGCAVAAQRDGLLPLNQMSMEFYNRVGYHDYEGVALNLEEQERLVEDIGGHTALILRNHGLLTVGESAAQAFLRMHYLERACEIQVTAQAGGSALTIPSPEVCEYTARQLAGEASADFQDDEAYDLAWAAMLRLLDRTAPDYKD
ncbi:class II aldolase/adducin family protein [Streptomyces sp. NPDC051219]|uniref:class II aldolase/adducin family protein n=1 Tax=Streptomyces sp. NPDC051219 TaxID=3155283 RepID=UPI0034281BBA